MERPEEVSSRAYRPELWIVVMYQWILGDEGLLALNCRVKSRRSWA